MPYLPVLDFLKDYFDIEEDDREATINKKVQESLRKLDENMEVVPPALHEVLSLKVEDEKYVQLGPQQRRERTFEAIRDLLIRESQRKPLILAVEDLHWIDKTSEEFLDYLIGFLPTAQILLILLYRPEYTHTWGSKSYYGKIGLDQLSAQTSAELVQAILEGGDVAPEIAGLVLGRAGGNPLFVEELTHSLVENGSIQKKDDHFVLARKPSEIEVPDTIQGIIAARMDRIEDNLKRIMQAASVIGREFAYRILQSIMGMSEELKASLLNLQGLEFIYEKQLFPDLEYIFKHALTQEVAYSSLLLKRRKEIHEKIGQAIEELYSERLEEYYELLGYHYTRSENREKAIEYLHLSNQKAAKAYAIEAARAHFDDAMRLLDAIPDSEANRERRVSLLINQAVVFEQLNELQEYYEILRRYETMAVGLGNPGLLGGFHSRMGFCEMWFGWLDRSIQTTAKAAKLSETGGNFEDAALAYCVMEHNYEPKGAFDLVFDMKENALRMMGKAFHLQWYTRALCGASMAYSDMGRWDEALGTGQNAMYEAERFSDNAQIAYAAWIISRTYGLKGDLDRALEYGKVAVGKTPLPAHKAMMQCNLAWIWCLSGEVDRGLELLAESFPKLGKNRFVLFELINISRFAEAYWLAEDYDKAKQTAERALEMARRCRANYYIGSAHRILGQIVSTTNPEEAFPHLKEAIAISQAIKAENELALAYSGVGRYHKQQGNVEQAREYLTKALEIFERLGTLIEPDKVREELAGLPS